MQQNSSLNKFIVSSIIVNYYNCKWWSESIYTTFVRCDKCPAGVDVHSRSLHSLCRANSICHSPISTMVLRWILKWEWNYFGYAREINKNVLCCIRVRSFARQLTYRLSMHRQSYSCILRKSFHRRVLRECFSSCAIECIRSLLCVNRWEIYLKKKCIRKKNLLFKSRLPYFHSIIVVCSVHTTHYSKHTRRWLERDDKTLKSTHKWLALRLFAGCSCPCGRTLAIFFPSQRCSRSGLQYPSAAWACKWAECGSYNDN